MNGQAIRAARILVVDDNPGIHRDFDLVLSEAASGVELEAEEARLYGPQAAPPLAKPQYTLDHAFSGTEGVERIKSALAQGQPYQMAFVDIRMPGIDGVETIARAWQLDSKIQMVICTAYADYSWEELVQRLGQTDQLLVLKKPFDNLEVTLLASTLTEKWFLARQAALKLEEMERLVAQRTQKILALQPGPPAPEEASGSPAHNGSTSPKELPLLLVAGQSAARRTLVDTLAADYRVLEAGDGATALQHTEESIPDLVLAEFHLPKVDGLEMCRRLRNSELASHIPVLLIAGDGVSDPEVQAARAGADDCLRLPLHGPSLKARIEQLLASRREPPLPDLRLPSTNRMEAHFVRRLTETVDRHLADYEFDVDALARKLGLSRRQLFRKLKAVIGLTPNVFIRNLRLKRAAQLLDHSQLTVTEVTYAVGFADLKHFRTVFREHFGVLPGEYGARAQGHAGHSEPAGPAK